MIFYLCWRQLDSLFLSINYPFSCSYAKYFYCHFNTHKIEMALLSFLISATCDFSPVFFFFFLPWLESFLSHRIIFWLCRFYLSVALLNFIAFCFYFYCVFFSRFYKISSSSETQVPDFRAFFLSWWIQFKKLPSFRCFPPMSPDRIFLFVISQYLSLTLESSWSHVILRTALFNFQVFGGFPLLFLMLSSSWISLCSRSRYVTSVLQYGMVCFVI